MKLAYVQSVFALQGREDAQAHGHSTWPFTCVLSVMSLSLAEVLCGCFS